MQVPQLRAERHLLTVDPRFAAVIKLIRDGAFGWQDFFAPLMANVMETDFYLVANDFPAYLDIQVRLRLRLLCDKMRVFDFVNYHVCFIRGQRALYRESVLGLARGICGLH